MQRNTLILCFQKNVKTSFLMTEPRALQYNTFFTQLNLRYHLIDDINEILNMREMLNIIKILFIQPNCNINNIMETVTDRYEIPEALLDDITRILTCVHLGYDSQGN